MSLNDVQQLQEDLQSLQLWESTWLLKFSIPKCHVLKVTRATKHKIISDYYLHDTPLQIVENCKYLGITIQSDLKGALYSSYKASQDIVCFALKEILWSLN